MRTLLAAGLLALPLAASAAPADTDRTPLQAEPVPREGAQDAGRAGPEECRTLRVDRARRGAATPSRLGDLPPGDLHLTVQREVDGCLQDVIVNTGYGR